MPDETLQERTRVLVIGGGPVGLIVSGLLSQRGIAHVLVERRREPQRTPAAHPARLRHVEHDARGVELRRLDLRPPDPVTGERLPEPWTNCPQNLLEPILLRHASRQAQATIALGAECVAIYQTDARVSARIRRDDGSERCIEAAWAIAADGAARPTRRRLGIAMQGAGPARALLDGPLRGRSPALDRASIGPALLDPEP